MQRLASWSASRITFHVSRHYVLRFTLYFFLLLSLGLIAAAQLLPTLELSRFSMRSGGLPWREAVSFSVRPWELPRALLPPYLVTPLLPEGIAYLGIIGLALAGWGAWRAVRSKDGRGIALLVMGGMGVLPGVGRLQSAVFGRGAIGRAGICAFPRAIAVFGAVRAGGVAVGGDGDKRCAPSARMDALSRACCIGGIGFRGAVGLRRTDAARCCDCLTRLHRSATGDGAPRRGIAAG